MRFRRSNREVSMTNDQLASMYDYLMGNISHFELSEELHLARTNTYYYIGRACDYWLQMGILRFLPITDQKELGGKEREKPEPEGEKNE